MIEYQINLRFSVTAEPTEVELSAELELGERHPIFTLIGENVFNGLPGLRGVMIPYDVRPGSITLAGAVYILAPTAQAFATAITIVQGGQFLHNCIESAVNKYYDGQVNILEVETAEPLVSEREEPGRGRLARILGSFWSRRSAATYLLTVILIAALTFLLVPTFLKPNAENRDLVESVERLEMQISRLEREISADSGEPVGDLCAPEIFVQCEPAPEPNAVPTAEEPDVIVYPRDR